MVDCCEHGNEPSDSVKVGNFLTSGVNFSFSRKILFIGINYLINSINSEHKN